ncbi:helix-turn-helix domain-containing protein [Desulfogranum japonicum]|uniref:helix-turn-helix domain-containing protein n=1 Tax=Desulfogranum japonicum TaxID=231447 RepID=UPI000A073B10
MASRGKTAARKLIHAQILLHADEASNTGGLTDTAIAEAVHCSRLTVERVRKRFVLEGLDSALNPKIKKHRRPKRLDGEAEAFLIATACSPTPKGRSKWTMQLLADRLIECDMVVKPVLKKEVIKNHHIFTIPSAGGVTTFVSEGLKEASVCL